MTIMMTGDTPEVYIMDFNTVSHRSDFKMPLPSMVLDTLYISGAGGSFCYDLKEYAKGRAVYLKVGRKYPYQKACGNCEHYCVRAICTQKKEVRQDWDYCIQWSEIVE